MARSCLDLTCLQKSPLWFKLVKIRGNSFFEEGAKGNILELGGLGYMVIPHLICSLKQVEIDFDKLTKSEALNICIAPPIAKARVTNKHCIGALKSQ